MLIDRIIENGIIFLLIFTPLAIGTVQPWSIAIMEITAFSLFFLFFLTPQAHSGHLLSSPVGAFGLRTNKTLSPQSSVLSPQSSVLSPKSPVLQTKSPLPLLSLLFLSLTALALFQMVPLPQWLLRIFSPSSLTTYQKFGDYISGTFHPISLNPYGTRLELFKWLAYGAVFFVIVNHYQTKAQVNRLIKAILFMGCFLVVIALAQKTLWNERIFWFFPLDETLRSGRGIWGPYINRNHFAGYMEMVIPFGLGLLLYNAPELKSIPGDSLRRRMRRVLVGENLLPFLLPFLLVLAMAAALFMTLSRGGILGFSASALFFVWITRTRRSLKKKTVSLVLLASVIFSLVFLSVWERVEERFEALQEDHHINRLNVWQDSLGIVRDYPIWGTGLGTFENAYMRFQTRKPLFFFDHAHNDYLELITDLGFMGAMIGLVLAVVFFMSLYRRWREKHGMFSKCIGAGGLSACIAMAVHSFTDFNLHIPANALLFTVTCAITYVVIFKVNGRNGLNGPEAMNHSQSYCGRATESQGPQGILGDQDQSPIIRPDRISLKTTERGAAHFFPLFFRAKSTEPHSRKRPFYTWGLLSLAGLLFFFPVRDLTADYYYRQTDHILDDQTTEELDVQQISEKSMPAYHEALRSLRTASVISPSHSLYHKALSELYFRLGKWAQTMGSLKAPLPPDSFSFQEATQKGLFHLKKAIETGPTNPDYHLALGRYLDLDGGDSLGADREFKKALEAFPINAPLRYVLAHHFLLTERKGDALEQAGILARIDDSYIIPESIKKTIMVEERNPQYISILSNSYLFGALEIAWRATKDVLVVKGIAPETPDALMVLQVFKNARKIK